MSGDGEGGLTLWKASTQYEKVCSSKVSCPALAQRLATSPMPRVATLRALPTSARPLPSHLLAGLQGAAHGPVVGVTVRNGKVIAAFYSGVIHILAQASTRAPAPPYGSTMLLLHLACELACCGVIMVASSQPLAPRWALRRIL